MLDRCVQSVADYQRATCERAPTEESKQECLASLHPCATGGEQCKFLACIDSSLGNASDGRIKMVGQ